MRASIKQSKVEEYSSRCAAMEKTHSLSVQILNSGCRRLKMLFLESVIKCIDHTYVGQSRHSILCIGIVVLIARWWTISQWCFLQSWLRCEFCEPEHGQDGQQSPERAVVVWRTHAERYAVLSWLWRLILNVSDLNTGSRFTRDTHNFERSR